MTDLTALTIAGIRDGLKAKAFSAVELTRAYLAAMEKARSLNAYIVETPEQALAMATQSDARIARGEMGALEGVPLGICGLLKREWLDHADLGYAFLPAGRGRGYAIEAARATLDWAAERGIAPVQAIVSPGNRRSLALLARLGFVEHGNVTVPGTEAPVLLLQKA